VSGIPKRLPSERYGRTFLGEPCIKTFLTCMEDESMSRLGGPFLPPWPGRVRAGPEGGIPPYAAPTLHIGMKSKVMMSGCKRYVGRWAPRLHRPHCTFALAKKAW
jgi:hypothetical protein